MLRTLLAAVLVSSLVSVASAQKAGKDEETVRQMQADFAAAWNKHDAKAMAALWAEDGDVINPAGKVAKGRADVEKLMAEEHATFAKGTTFTNNVTGVRFLKPDVALLDASYEIAGVMGPGGKAGSMKGLYTVVLVKKGGKWWVSSARPMVPLPEPSAPAKK
jgi:uncharacterized protein (TIGR02246 family)